MISSTKRTRATDLPKMGLNECYCSFVERITMPYQHYYLKHHPTGHAEQKSSQNSPFLEEPESHSVASNILSHNSYLNKTIPKQVSDLKSFKLRHIYSSAMREIDAHDQWVSSIIHFRNTNRNNNHYWWYFSAFTFFFVNFTKKAGIWKNILSPYKSKSNFKTWDFHFFWFFEKYKFHFLSSLT